MFDLPDYPEPSSTIILTISARNLKDKDLFSKSDPICIVYRFKQKSYQQVTQPEWLEVGRTEHIMNCLNPEFTKQILIEYFFEEKQPLKFDLYDIDNINKELDSQDFLGTMECDLAEIVSTGGVFTKALGGLPGNCGFISISGEEVADQREYMELRCNALKLDKKDFFGKSDPFLKIYKINDDGSRRIIHKTEFLKKTLNPTWKPFEVKCDKNHDLWIECWDDNLQASRFEPDYIGACQVSIRSFTQESPLQIPLINEKKKLKKGEKYKNSGTLCICARLFSIPTFLDYISGGTELEFLVAIDFTMSNLSPCDPKSLHYLSDRPNQYELALRAVLEICEFYNKKREFEAYGFGAIVPGGSKVSHLFSLKDPQAVLQPCKVAGTAELLNSYHTCIRTVKFYGPTNFFEIIQEAAKKASFYRNGKQYQILLIITDGAICDMPQTKKAIVEASGLPLSIIIVGVGTADFENMNELDGDAVRISHNGRLAERDIVQFVAMNEFLKPNELQMDSFTMAKLAKEVLNELPLQLTSYMRSRNIMPIPQSSVRNTTLTGSYKTVENLQATAPPMALEHMEISY